MAISAGDMLAGLLRLGYLLANCVIAAEDIGYFDDYDAVRATGRDYTDALTFTIVKLKSITDGTPLLLSLLANMAAAKALKAYSAAGCHYTLQFVKQQPMMRRYRHGHDVLLVMLKNCHHLISKWNKTRAIAYRHDTIRG